jgi:hypothetical protein
MDEAEWQAVLRSKTKIPSELARIKVSRYGFHQLNKQSPSLGSRLRSQRSRRISNNARRANYATDITNEIAMTREANRLIEFYSEPYQLVHPHKTNDENLRKLDIVIHSLKMFRIINKTDKYDFLLEELERIRKEIPLEGGRRRKTRKHKRNTRKS